MGNINSLESLRRGLPPEALADPHYTRAFTRREVSTAAAAVAAADGTKSSSGSYFIDGVLHLVPTLHLSDMFEAAGAGRLRDEHERQRWQQLCAALIDMRNQPQTVLMYQNRRNDVHAVRSPEDALKTWVWRRPVKQTDAELFGQQAEGADVAPTAAAASLAALAAATHARPHSSMCFLEVRQEQLDAATGRPFFGAPCEELIQALGLIALELPTVGRESGSTRIWGVPHSYVGAGGTPDIQLGVFKTHISPWSEVSMMSVLRLALRAFGCQLLHIGADLRRSVVSTVEFSTNQNNTEVQRMLADTLTLVLVVDALRKHKQQQKAAAAQQKAEAAAQADDGVETAPELASLPPLCAGDLRLELVDHDDGTQAFQVWLAPSIFLHLMHLVVNDVLLARRAGDTSSASSACSSNHISNNSSNGTGKAKSGASKKHLLDSLPNAASMTSFVFEPAADGSSSTGAAAASSSVAVSSRFALNPSLALPFREAPSPAALGCLIAPQQHRPTAFPLLFGVDALISADDAKAVRARASLAQNMFARALLQLVRAAKSAAQLIERIEIETTTAAAAASSSDAGGDAGVPTVTRRAAEIDWHERRFDLTQCVVAFLDSQQADGDKTQQQRLVFTLRTTPQPTAAVVELVPLSCSAAVTPVFETQTPLTATMKQQQQDEMSRLVWEVAAFTAGRKKLVWMQRSVYIAKGVRPARAAAPAPAAPAAAAAQEAVVAGPLSDAAPSTVNVGAGGAGGAGGGGGGGLAAAFWGSGIGDADPAQAATQERMRAVLKNSK